MTANNESERALVFAILSDMDYNDGGMMRWSSGRPTEQAERVADRIVRELAGLRRTEVPEPSAEATNDERNDLLYVLDEELSEAPTVQLMARKGGKTQTLIEQMLNQANERGIRVEIVDQVIPRYAMLDVWMALYDHDNSQAFDGFYESAGYAEAWATLLAAIRARAGEPQGEPSDAQHTEARTAFRDDPDSDGMTLGEAFSTGWFAALRAAQEAR